jgi:hypothetical protein
MIGSLISFLLFLSHVFCDQMPLPFKRELYVTNPMMSGSDVLIAQTLLLRYFILRHYQSNEVTHYFYLIVMCVFFVFINRL